jgi:hypothetical protein
LRATRGADRPCCVGRRNDPIARWSQAIVACAGPAAEQRYAGYPQDVVSHLWRGFWKTDRANAEYWLGLIRGVTLQQAEAMARHLVDTNWSAIVRAEAGEIGGVTLDRLWREPAL